MNFQPEASSAANYQGETEVITNQAQITALLRQVLEARCLLQVTVPGETDAYTSTLLDLNTEQHYLLLDELNPAAGHQAVLQQRRLTASARLRGIDIRFTCPIEEVDGQQGIAFYRSKLPAKLYYRQRRSAFRIRLGLGLVIPLHIQHADNLVLDGTLCDLSIGGIGARLHGRAPLELGQVLTHCELQLPKGGTIVSEVEVRYAGEPDQKQDMRIGARFVNLSRAQTAKMERFVMEVEREILRRSHNS